MKVAHRVIQYRFASIDDGDQSTPVKPFKRRCANKVVLPFCFDDPIHRLSKILAGRMKIVIRQFNDRLGHLQPGILNDTICQREEESEFKHRIFKATYFCFREIIIFGEKKGSENRNKWNDNNKKVMKYKLFFCEKSTAIRDGIRNPVRHSSHKDDKKNLKINTIKISLN